MDEQTTSPTAPATPKPLNFYDALKSVAEGKRITKDEWNNPSIFGFLDEERLKITLESGIKDWIVSEADMVGTDWRVL